jgi:hypothetical protein
MRLPSTCPSCESGLNVKTLHCEKCQTTVDGNYQLPVLASLSDDTQQFIIDFVKNSGSLKEMAKTMQLSYPSVRNRLDEIIDQLTELTKK